MNYNTLIRDAWSTTWHHRFLWILGLFTGAAVGTCSGVGNGSQFRSQSQPSDFSRTYPTFAAMANAVVQWVVTHPVLVGSAVVFAVALGVALLIVSFIAQGGMTEATIELAHNEPTSFGRAWSEGRHLFWRFAGLALLCVGAAIIVAIPAAAIAAVAVGTTALASGPAQAALIGMWVSVGIIAALLVIPIFIGFTIALAFAQRATVVENVGPIAALRSGFHLMREHLGSSLLTWVVSLGLSIAVNLAIVLVTVVVAAILVVFGMLLWNAVGLTSTTIVYATLGGVATLAVFVGLESIANAFFWNFWTLAYLHLVGSR